MTPDDPDDKAVLEQMLARREASRARRAAQAAQGAAPARPAGAGTMAGKWAEPLGGSEEEDGLFAALPRSTPVGIIAVDGPRGVTLYRDGRSRFSMLIPGRPRFVAPGEGIDAACTLTSAPITVHALRLPPQPDVPLAHQCGNLAGDITQTTPEAIELDGAPAAATAVLDQGVEVRRVAVLAGGVGVDPALIVLMIDHTPARVDPATAATVEAIVIGSAAFTGEPRRRIPAVLPDSPWLEAGLPLSPRADHPPAPATDDPAATSARLLAIAGLRLPTDALDDDARAAIDAAVPGASAGLSTFHDLRGLARALHGAGATAG